MLTMFVVRVSKLRDDLTSSLQDHIRRVYPIIQGPNNWGNIVENREKYFNDKNKFPLVQEPLIEAIPQYASGDKSRPEDMKNWKYSDSSDFSEKDSDRMKLLGEILTTKINGKKYGVKKDNILPCASQQRKTNLVLPELLRPKYFNDVVLRTVPSYQQKNFSSFQQRLFYSSDYSVSKSFDRMGYRLTGKKITGDIEGILSEGICQGAIQIPADGQPIVLLNDRQTIGGYPKIGAVMSIDIAKLGQLKQGDKVRFEPISMEQAHNCFHLNLSYFNRKKLNVCD